MSNNNNGIDPYKILSVKKDFTIDQLRNNFKKLAKIVHPDNPKTGNHNDFILLSKCYKTLYNDYKLRENDKQYYELKANFDIYKNEQNTTNSRNTELKTNYSNDSKFQKDFNETFEKFKIETVYDKGYGEVMKNPSAVREDININNSMGNGKFNKKKFNEQFDNLPVNSENKLIKHSTPEPLMSSNHLAYSDLGLTEINDFSGDNDTLKRLNYTDYMKAYTTTRLIDPKSVEVRKEYKTIDDVKKHREKVSYTMSEADMIKQHNEVLLQEQKEKNRIAAVQNMDDQYTNQYKTVNKVMLRYKK